MPEKAWKQEERKVARALGGERTPLSGSNSRHTSGDVIDTPYYVDCKLAGQTNSTGERIYTLPREAIEEAAFQAEAEGKELAALTVRFKHCSERYAFLPWAVWEELAEAAGLGGTGGLTLGNTMGHRSGGEKSTRIYRKKLQHLSHVYQDEGEYKALYLWWSDSDKGSTCDTVGITWESLLWLIGRLWVCPSCQSWQALNSVDPEPECPDCSSIMTTVQEVM